MQEWYVDLWFNLLLYIFRQFYCSFRFCCLIQTKIKVLKDDMLQLPICLKTRYFYHFLNVTHISSINSRANLEISILETLYYDGTALRSLYMKYVNRNER